jgi:hypothetical protein
MCSGYKQNRTKSLTGVTVIRYGRLLAMDSSIVTNKIMTLTRRNMTKSTKAETHCSTCRERSPKREHDSYLNLLFINASCAEDNWLRKSLVTISLGIDPRV